MNINHRGSLRERGTAAVSVSVISDHTTRSAPDTRLLPALLSEILSALVIFVNATALVFRSFLCLSLPTYFSPTLGRRLFLQWPLYACSKISISAAVQRFSASSKMPASSV
jgi:hypothetical protein